MYNQQKVVAGIAVRLGSKRLEKKAFVDVGGKPALERLIYRLRQSQYLDEICICTTVLEEDNELEKFAHDHGLTCVRGDVEKVIERFLALVKKNNADHFVRATGDNLFTDGKLLDKMIEAHISNGSDYTRTNKVPIGITGEVMKKETLQKIYETTDPLTSEYMMLYAFDPDRYNCSVLMPPPHLERPYYALTLDTPKDLELFRNVYQAWNNPNQEPTLEEIIKILDTHQWDCSIQAHTEIGLPHGKKISYDGYLQMMEEKAKKSKTTVFRS